MSLVFRVLLALAVVAPLPAAGVTDRLTRTLPLAPAAGVTVEVTAGELRVSGWDRAEAAIDLTRRAPDAAALARIPPRIDSTDTNLSIRVLQPDDSRDPALRSDLVLRVPRTVRLGDLSLFEGRVELDGLGGTIGARVERGDVLARNVSGTLRIETAMGDIRLEQARLSPDGLMRLRTFNGDVTLELAERPANARVLALSMGGTITSDLPLTRAERWGPRWAEATIGTGEPVISIDVVNGNVRLKLTN